MEINRIPHAQVYPVTPTLPLQKLHGDVSEQQHLYRNSVVGITEERMRQLAEHYSP